MTDEGTASGEVALSRMGKVKLSEDVVESLVPEVRELVHQFIAEGKVHTSTASGGVRSISLEHPQFSLVESGIEPEYAVRIARLRDGNGNPLYRLFVKQV